VDMAEPSDDLTVLVVDDDELIRKLVDTYLGGCGYRVLCAANGADGLEQVRLHLPDVVLLDVTLPGMDGWETCRRIREFSDVPILMLSARAQLSDREKGFASGADDYITKPMSLKDMEMRIREAVRRSPARDARPGEPG
jgi:DNA-binding response OmpR family regulator